MLYSRPEVGFEKTYRAVAQLASAPALGAGGREFESRQPDHSTSFGLLGLTSLMVYDQQIKWRKFRLKYRTKSNALSLSRGIIMYIF